MTRVARPFKTKKEAIKAAEEDLKQGYKIYRHEEGQWIAEGELKIDEIEYVGVNEGQDMWEVNYTQGTASYIGQRVTLDDLKANHREHLYTEISDAIADYIAEQGYEIQEDNDEVVIFNNERTGVVYTDGKGNFAVGLKGEQLFKAATVSGLLYGQFVEEFPIYEHDIDWQGTLDALVQKFETEKESYAEFFED